MDHREEDKLTMRDVIRSILWFYAVLLFIAVSCMACGDYVATGPVPGELKVVSATYYPRTRAIDQFDSVTMMIETRWHAGQFDLVLVGTRWPSARVTVASDGTARIPVTLVRVQPEPLAYPDTIYVHALGFKSIQYVRGAP